MSELDRLVRQAHQERPRFPFAPIPPHQIGVVELALRKAWRTMVRNADVWSADFSAEKEQFISDPLLNVLNCLRKSAQEDPFPALRDHFHPVTQNASYRNYMRNRLKSPDLIFTPKDSPYPGIDEGYYAFFVEAKIVDTLDEQTKTVGKYFADGVHRFVHGDYAWGMPHGMMLAYVRDGQQLPGAVAQFLERHASAVARGHNDDYQFAPPSRWAGPPNPLPKVLITMHHRPFAYVDREGMPGDVELRHLWLDIHDVQ